MAIDLATEHLLNMSQAAKLFPSSRGTRPSHISKVIRAITIGSFDPQRKRVPLEALRQGGQWVTSVEAIQRWCERLTPNVGPTPTGRTLAERKRANAAAERELELRGV